jgi:hypothetical protein
MNPPTIGSFHSVAYLGVSVRIAISRSPVPQTSPSVLILSAMGSRKTVRTLIGGVSDICPIYYQIFHHGLELWKFGRGAGVGRGLAVAAGLGANVGVGVGVTVELAVGVGEGG